MEIDLTGLEFPFQGYDEGGNVANTTTIATDFWVKVEKIFSSIERVVLPSREPRESGPPPPEETDEDYTIIETVVQCAPARIDVLIAFVAFSFQEEEEEEDGSPRYTLW